MVRAESRHGGSQENNFCWKTTIKYTKAFGPTSIIITLGLSCQDWANFFCFFFSKRKSNKNGKWKGLCTPRGSQESWSFSLPQLEWRAFTTQITAYETWQELNFPWCWAWVCLKQCTACRPIYARQLSLPACDYCGRSFATSMILVQARRAWRAWRTSWRRWLRVRGSCMYSDSCRKMYAIARAIN